MAKGDGASGHRKRVERGTNVSYKDATASIVAASTVHGKAGTYIVRLKQVRCHRQAERQKAAERRMSLHERCKRGVCGCRQRARGRWCVVPVCVVRNGAPRRENRSKNEPNNAMRSGECYTFSWWGVFLLSHS